MTLHRFQLFVSIARQLNITKVSQALHVSQPSVSHQLKLLQEEYGITLFTKNGRGLELTETGRAFLRDVEPITAQIEGLRAKYLGRQTLQDSDSLSVGGSHGPSVSVLPYVMTQFKQRHPRADLNLKTGTSTQIEQLVLRHHLDIAVITNPFASPSLRMEPFRKEILAVFVAANHRLATKKNLEIDELASLPLVIRGNRGGRNRTEVLLSELAAHGVRPNIFMRCESPDSVKAAVRNGAGVGILYRDAIESAVQAGAFSILEVSGLELGGPSFIVYSSERPLSPSALEFLLLLRMARRKQKP